MKWNLDAPFWPPKMHQDIWDAIAHFEVVCKAAFDGILSVLWRQMLHSQNGKAANSSDSLWNNKQQPQQLWITCFSSLLVQITSLGSEYLFFPPNQVCKTPTVNPHISLKEIAQLFEILSLELWEFLVNLVNVSSNFFTSVEQIAYISQQRSGIQSVVLHLTWKTRSCPLLCLTQTQ